MIVQDLRAHKDEFPGKLTLTSQDPVPIEIDSANIREQHYLLVTYEDAGTMIVHHIVHSGVRNALVVADDTDVFVFLCHFVHTRSISAKVMMISPQKGRSVRDINKTAMKHRSLMSNLLASHGFSGCDTVVTTFSIGKCTVVKISESGKYSLSKL